MKSKQFEKVNGLDCYFYKSMLMRDRRMRENSKLARHALVLLVSLFDFYISLPSGLSIRARSSSLSASTSLGCPFFVGQRVVSI